MGHRQHARRRIPLTAGQSAFFFGAAGSGTSAELRATADKLLVLADQLERSGIIEAAPSPKRSAAALERRLPQLASIAAIEYDRRRARDRHLPPDLLGEPAWDILLDLLVLQARGKQTPVTSACLGSGVASTTALRWITALEACGFVKRTASGHDKRVVYLTLTRSALEALDLCLMSGNAS
jgi:hypothetical protein